MRYNPNYMNPEMAGWVAFEFMYDGYTFIEDNTLEEQGITYIYTNPSTGRDVIMYYGNVNNG